MIAIVKAQAARAESLIASKSLSLIIVVLSLYFSWLAQRLTTTVLTVGYCASTVTEHCVQRVCIYYAQATADCHCT